jgi:ABC-type dipeptide/oligopeptide/nickel transport system permease component
MNAFVFAICAIEAALFIGVVAGILADGKSPQKARNKPKTSNVVLAALGVFALAFIVTMIVVFCIKGAVPDTLIQYTLGAGGIEAVALSAIKVAKVKCGTKEEVE